MFAPLLRLDIRTLRPRMGKLSSVPRRAFHDFLASSSVAIVAYRAMCTGKVAVGQMKPKS